MITSSMRGGQAGSSRPLGAQAVCACGAVYAYGSVEIDPRFAGMCMRCAVANGFRPVESVRRGRTG
jgi:hypothetical protein